MIYVIVVVAALCVACAIGANDNFKGVATLFGSGTTNYRRALAWATGVTLPGSAAARNLIKSFGGKGLDCQFPRLMSVAVRCSASALLHAAPGKNRRHNPVGVGCIWITRQLLTRTL